jgi:hypothetical protein
MVDYDEFNITYILNAIEYIYIYIYIYLIFPVMFSKRNRLLSVKEGGFVK